MTALKRKRAPGGGRKPIAQGGTVRKTLTLLVDDLAYLNTIDANTSKAVRQLVREHRALAWLLAMVNTGGWVDPPLVGVELDPAYAEIAKRRVEEALAKGVNSD